MLYKYLDYKGRVSMLENTNMQFTQSTKLNDPFDCNHNLFDFLNPPKDLCYIFGNSVEEMSAETISHFENIRQKTGVCSLSKVNDQLLMWSHYAKHQGVCIGLDLSKIKLVQIFQCFHVDIFPVRYISRLSKVDYWLDFKKDPNRMNSLRYLLSTKSIEWEYEQEVRLIVTSPTYSPEFPFRPLLNSTFFKALYLGINISIEQKKEIINLSKYKYPEMPIYQMKVDADMFQLIPELINL